MKKNWYKIFYAIVSKTQLQNMNWSDYNEDCFSSGGRIITAPDQLTTIINIPMRNTLHSIKYRHQQGKYWDLGLHENDYNKNINSQMTHFISRASFFPNILKKFVKRQIGKNNERFKYDKNMLPILRFSDKNDGR